MLEKYQIQYNGSTSADHGAILYDYAKFSGAQKHYNTIAVSGMLGELVSTDDYTSNATINCTFGILNKNFMETVRDIRRWLRGTGELIISDNPDVYYRVWKINYGDINRELRKYGQFSVDFLCTPYEYALDGKQEYDSLSYNSYDECKPVYIINGTGKCTLTVNGKTMEVQVDQEITIDTNKMLAYRDPLILQNTLVSGNYEDLWISSGDVSINVSDGFTIKIIPNWGWKM